ncbi:iron uptake system protein EfeO [Methylocapsa sp. S129]|uniref:iron uptake system protein EfeO n=1 Tax=Methylocapsa sp. S129 TaxID=1641869 RepID=UPI00131DCC63|nr:iron uptake system protein EfeO [Methylocapsa sp. S129]
MNKSRIILGGVAIIALMVAVGGATYFMARHPVASAPPAAGASPAASTQGAQSATAAVNVNVTASACDPNELTVPAGRVTFSIHNQGSRALEWEILNGVMVVDERENIAPGFSAKLTTRLEPGDYDITCGLLSSPKGRLHVAAFDAASAKPSQIDLIGPLAEYRVYASYEIDALVDDAKRFADAVKSGDLDAARALFPVAHAHYARLAPIARLFPDLDRAIDSSASEHDKKEADPGFTGFHRLEWGLFAGSDSGNLDPLADKLAADVVALQNRFEDFAMNPEPTIAGAADVIGKTALGRISGEADRGSGADLSDLQANVEGVKKIVDLFRPLIARVDNPLSLALAEDFSTIDATLAKYRTADGAYKPAAHLSADDRAALQNATKKLAGELARVRGALGLS